MHGSFASTGTGHATDRALVAGLLGFAPDDERINIPAIAQHYWRYRMPITLEALGKEKHFNAALKEMIKTAER